MVGNGIQVGPWGGNGGVNPWTFIPDGRISQIRISAGGCVDSIRFTCIDHDGVEQHSVKYGGDGGSPHTITFSEDETLIEISGTTGEIDRYHFTVITSLYFKTNKKTHGPYGTIQRTVFSLPVTKGSFGGFSGNSGLYLDSFGVILHPSLFENTIGSNMPTNGVHVGPWGDKRGHEPWTFIADGRISQIRISAGVCVDSIMFTYIDQDHVEHHSEKYGGHGGTPQTITFDDDEKLIGISGTVGVFNSCNVIMSLSFHTNNNKNHGPYGKIDGTSFSLPVAKGSFVGFSGSNNGDYLKSFGVILRPSSLEDEFRSFMTSSVVKVGPWGGNDGVNPWTFMPSGRICQIHISAGFCVDSIMFTYKDQEHVERHSKKYGGDGGSPQTITFDDDENLNGISGTVGLFDKFTVITSLSFETNKKNHGPYGTNIGTSFSLPVAKGSVIGFNGNNGCCLHSFGVILHPSSFRGALGSFMTSTVVQVGPWGGNDGVNPWTFAPSGRICHIRINVGFCVDSIMFTYKDQDQVEHHSEKYGGDGGSPQMITFADDENLIGVSGTVGLFHSFTVITSLSFQTNKKNHGPYGTNHGTSFSLPIAKGSFGGFSGNNGGYLHSFGVILHPSSFKDAFRSFMTSSVVQIGPWGGKGGVNPWTYMPSGRICEIRINAGRYVDSIGFTYIDQDEVKHQSEKYGGAGGSPHRINFDEDEKLIRIDGTVGLFDKFTVITSLCFYTNKKKCGPYGTNERTDFSLPVDKGNFVGFTGNHGDFLHSFGAILHPSSFENEFISNMGANDVHVGPWGGDGGVIHWTFIPDGRISQIRISAGGCVDSIIFTYINHDGVEQHSEKYGGDGGSPHTITFSQDEDLIQIRGTMGLINSFTVITSLSFQTNKNNHGPYGTNIGTCFSLPIAKGRFRGFRGKYGEYLDSFCAILHPY